MARSKKPSSQPYYTRLHLFIMSSLPVTLCCSQCVIFREEILICGGLKNNKCYSYHTLKQQYKEICEYPADIILFGHCVIKYESNFDNNENSNTITLLSFGGGKRSTPHTLLMKYQSVWEGKRLHQNQWI